MQEHGMQMQGMQARYAPGARVVIRDCEWIVRRADSCDDGGYVLTVDGLSELVSGKSARFLTNQADNRQLAPNTELPADFFSNLTPHWQRHNVLRSDYARRQALAEIDVLVGVGLPRKTRQGDLKNDISY